MEADSTASHCRNCGTVLRGAYCHECGQSAKVVRRHFRDLVEDVLGNILQWDSRLFVTLKLLLFRPGQLAFDWITGKRSRYVPPFRLYVVASFILFLLLGFQSGEVTRQVQVIEVDSASVQELRQDLETARANGDWLEQVLLQGTLQVIEDPEGFQRRILSNLPNAAFLLLPVFAALHMLANLRRERYYVDHLVFSLHFHAFTFLLLSLVILIGFLSRPIGNLAEYLQILVPVYLAVGFHRFNQQGWGTCLLKAGLVLGAYLLVLVAGLVLYFTILLAT